MATNYLPGAVRPANPTRRAFIGAASLTIPVAAMAELSGASSPRREWDRLVADFHHAEAHATALRVEHAAAEDSYFSAREMLGERPEAPRIQYPRPIGQMTIDELSEVAAPPHEREQFASALSSWKAQSADLRQRTMGDVEERWEAAIQAQGTAAKAVFAHPAPDAAALLFKLDLAEREYRGFDLDETVAKQVFADVRRFMCGEA